MPYSLDMLSPITVPSLLSIPDPPSVIAPAPQVDMAEVVAAVAGDSINKANLSTNLPPPKKAKFFRRLIDFFHHLGSHHHHKDYHDASVPSITHTDKIQNAKHSSAGLKPDRVLVQHEMVTAGEVKTPAASEESYLSSPTCLMDKSSVTHGRAGHSHPRIHLRILGRFSLSRHLGSHHERDEILHPRYYQQPHKRSNSRSSRSDEDSVISDTELEIARQRIPGVSSASDLCFKKKYRFLGSRVIGKGSSGTVRLGCALSDPSDHPKTFAVKEFRRQRKNETVSEYLRKLTAEYCIAAKMSHSNVVLTFDMVHDGTKWYEIMEFCAQGDLFSFIQHGGLNDMSEIDCCFKQLVEGVKYMHSIGVAHRDLKPENLLIDGYGKLKITDFGVSDVFLTEGGGTGLSKGICGSSPYIAPEEYLGSPYDARKVDIWSIGIIYYAMVFHGIPWESATNKDPNYCHYLTCGASKFEPFTRLPHGSRCLLRKMLEPDPAKRISINEIIQDDWFRHIVMVPLFRKGTNNSQSND